MKLSGKHILVIEDEALIAMDLQWALSEAGASIAGPVATLGDAMDVAAEGNYAAAVLDINLEGEDVFPVARLLRNRKIPFVFYTGHGEPRQLNGEFANVPLVTKPAAMSELIDYLAELLD